MILTGTLVNTAAVLLGGGAGLLVNRLLRRGIPERFSDTIIKAIALAVICISLDGIMDGSNPLITIFSLVAGVIVGELLDLDARIQALSERLEHRFSSGERGTFSKGFLSATLLFCVGTMAIKGAMDSALLGDHSTLYAKSIMDAIGACLFASTLGIGVLFSAAAVLVYQGSISLLSLVAAPFLSDVVISEMNVVGSLLLFAMSMNLLGATKLRLMNYVPAMFLPIFFCIFLS